MIVLSSGVLISVSIHPGHNWSGDFALYIQQAAAILDGSLNSLYALNKFSMQHSISEKGPFLYPNGFPLILTPIYYFFGVDLVKIKILCSTFLLGSIPLAYSLFRQYFSNGFHPIIVIVFMALNVSFIQFTDSIRSELPFLFFSLLSFRLMYKEPKLIGQLLLGLCAFFTYYIRDIGIFLLPALLIFQLFFNQNLLAKIKGFVIPVVVFFGLWTVNMMTSLNGGENHIRILLESTTMSSISLNFRYYVELVSVYFFNEEFFLLGILVMSVAGIGIAANIKKSAPIAVYVISVLGIVFIWPSQQGIRFLLPVLPFIALFLLQGILFLTDMLRFNKKIVNLVLLVATLSFIDNSVDRVLQEQTIQTNQSCTEEMMEIYLYVSQEIPANSVVGFHQPRILRLFSGVNSIFTDLAHFGNSVGTHLVIRNDEVNSENSNQFAVKHRFKNYMVLEK